mmetsp:Transcript_1291/g.2071  ORF Transcript_1291/g.2071 Transcript_1291/m.2071 type:complete len:103 (-) Transcript_1291:56-364(-)
MPRDTQCERNGGVDDGIDRVGNVGGENLGTAEFLVAPVSGEPYFAEGPLFGQDDLGVKHESVMVVGSSLLIQFNNLGECSRRLQCRRSNNVPSLYISLLGYT